MNNETKMMKRGLRQIDLSKWEEDETGTLNLYVTDVRGNIVHCWMILRPAYCDRGHVQLNIDGHLGLDGMDCFPRYFFSPEEADQHCRTFLKWRLWKYRIHTHGWGSFYKTKVRQLMRKSGS